MKRRKSERGQSAILAVVGLMILAIGMYTSANLSRTVYEKIQLQNAADATAYSLATMEARTFNLIAFVNRAHIASYLQTMEAQALLTNAAFVEGLTGRLGDYLHSFGEELLATPEPTAATKAAGTALVNAGLGFREAHEGLVPTVDALATVAKVASEAQMARNTVLSTVAALNIAKTAAQIADGGDFITALNDPNARENDFSRGLNVVNSAAFLTSFSRFNPFQGGLDKEGRMRAMTELTNASRYGTNLPSFIVSRGVFDGVAHLISSVIDVAGGDAIGDRIADVMQGINAIGSGTFVGTTKLVTELDSRDFDGELSQTKQHTSERSYLARGSALVSKDQSILPMMQGDGSFASLVATPERSRLCRYSAARDSVWGVAFGFIPVHSGGILAGQFNEGFYCETDEEENHKWGSKLLDAYGVAPYFAFASGKGSGLQKNTFRQPDVWTFLNKPSYAMARNARDGRNMTWTGSDSATIQGQSGLRNNLLGIGQTKGLNVLSRAQAYYHRPGAWNEPPNFFNPYWGARLAPKNEVVGRLLDEVGIAGILKDFIQSQGMLF